MPDPLDFALRFLELWAQREHPRMLQECKISVQIRTLSTLPELTPLLAPPKGRA